MLKSYVEITKAVIIIIRNYKEQYFVHQRNKDKKNFPNLFGLGAGGHMEIGETKEVAAERELSEETGLKTDLKYLFKVRYESSDFINEMEVFETKTKIENLETNNGEWQWSGWMNKEEIDMLIKKNKLCPDTKLVYKTYLDSVAS